MVYSIRTTRPLVYILRIVDDATPAIGFNYGAIDAAKKKIASDLSDDLSSYKENWDIIDLKCEHQLHRDLHTTEYFLNP